MKFINKEDEKKKVYVQLLDLELLKNFNVEVPNEVMQKINNPEFIVNEENEYNFIEFEEPSTVEFFNLCHWIIDFRHFRRLNKEEFYFLGYDVLNKRNRLAEKWNKMTFEEREKNPELFFEYKKLVIKYKTIVALLRAKKGLKEMPFPVVADDDGFVIDNKFSPYIAKQGINPLQVLFYKKDGEKFDFNVDLIPENLMKTAESLLINQNLENNEFFWNFDKFRCLTDDDKCLYTTFRMIPEKVNNINYGEQEETSILRKKIGNFWKKYFKK